MLINTVTYTRVDKCFEIKDADDNVVANITQEQAFCLTNMVLGLFTDSDVTVGPPGIDDKYADRITSSAFILSLSPLVREV